MSRLDRMEAAHGKETKDKPKSPEETAREKAAQTKALEEASASLEAAVLDRDAAYTDLAIEMGEDVPHTDEARDALDDKAKTRRIRLIEQRKEADSQTDQEKKLVEAIKKAGDAKRTFQRSVQNAALEATYPVPGPIDYDELRSYLRKKIEGQID